MFGGKGSWKTKGYYLWTYNILDSDGSPQRVDSDDEEVEDIDPPTSPEDIRESIKQKFLVEMPEDFYQFWDFCKSERADNPSGTKPFSTSWGMTRLKGAVSYRFYSLSYGFVMHLTKLDQSLGVHVFICTIGMSIFLKVSGLQVVFFLWHTGITSLLSVCPWQMISCPDYSSETGVISSKLYSNDQY